MTNMNDSNTLQAEADEKTETRAVFEGEVSTASMIGERWAIVVGISKYKHKRLNLKYAARDAQEFYNLLITPSGGQFKKENIELLLDKDATTTKITRALRSFLKKPTPGDFVLIYFACHGSPDLGLQDKAVFLLTHDTDPDDIAGTALPMDDINWSLRNIVKSQKVVILADTCHSAEIGGKGLRAVGDPNITNAYLKKLSEAKDGTVLIASTRAGELAQEGPKWGGGHGVFTYFLLKGMGGAADANGDGMVGIEELYDYVERNVNAATGGAQKPTISSTRYDRTLPISFPAWERSKQHYELGCQLFQMGTKFSEQHCLISANKHLQEAIDLAKLTQNDMPQAYLQKGLVLMADERLNAAVSALKDAFEAGEAEAAYHLGIAYLKQGKPNEAARELETFLKKQPTSDKAAWAKALISLLQPTEPSNRHALLIGINYPKRIQLENNVGLNPLRACVNDIEQLGLTLSTNGNFNVRYLSDSEATYENIKQDFNELKQQVKPNDVVVIHYSGHEDSGRWIAYDAGLADDGIVHNTIGYKEIYQMLNSIPCLHKYLIMDSPVSREFEEFIRMLQKHKDCTLLLAASPGQFSYEYRVDDKMFGAFTYWLIDTLCSSDPTDVSQWEIFQRVEQAINKKFPNQLPFFQGDRQKKLFSNELNHCPTLFEFTENHWKITSNDLIDLYNRSLAQASHSFPEMYYQFGLAFAEKGNFTQAVDALDIYLGQIQEQQNSKNILFALGVAQFKSQLYVNAIKTFQKYIGLAELDSDLHNSMSQIVSKARTLIEPFHVLLVGIDEYLYESNQNTAQGSDNDQALNDVVSLKRVLIDKFHFKENVLIDKENGRKEEHFYITSLLNDEAKTEAILKEFNKLVQRSPSPILFYFSGQGSVDAEGNPVILATDSRQDGVPDIRVDQLAKIASNTDSNLISIIDACWTDSKTANTRYAPPEGQASEKVQIAGSIERSSTQIPRVGYITLYPRSIKYQQQEFVKQNFTSELIEILKKAEANSLSYWKLRQAFARNQISTDFDDYDGNIYISSDGNALDEAVFSNPLCSKLQLTLQQIEQAPARRTVGIIKEFIGQQNGLSPPEYLNLGIMNYVLGEYKDSISALQTAINQLSQQSSKTVSQQSIYAQAHYWLGRVLHERRLDPARAVSELRLAIQYEPSNIFAHYYLGQALRVLGGPEILMEAKRALQTYLRKGAPLGQEEDVQVFLQS